MNWMRQKKNNLRRKGIKEDMAKVKAAVAESTMSLENLFGYQEIYLRMIFDIKLEGKFRRKYWLVARGHKKMAPSSISYS